MQHTVQSVDEWRVLVLLQAVSVRVGAGGEDSSPVGLAEVGEAGGVTGVDGGGGEEAGGREEPVEEEEEEEVGRRSVEKVRAVLPSNQLVWCACVWGGREAYPNLYMAWCVWKLTTLNNNTVVISPCSQLL